jgi:hypothetical protein
MVILLGICGGCTDFRVAEAHADADRIAKGAGFSSSVMDSAPFELLTYQRVNPAGDTVVVYFEGDGLAWINRGQVSDNPTPTDPVALRLAAADDAPTIVYLARPCQFVAGTERRNCDPKYWTTARFALEIVAASDRVIDLIKAATAKHKVELIGFSGGGVLATLIAARRTDVGRVITVAANLDLDYWTSYHDVTPLFQSLKPTDFTASLAQVIQIMFVGDRDDNVPPSIAAHYRASLPADARASIISIPNFSHQCCWADAWPNLLREARSVQ